MTNALTADSHARPLSETPGPRSRRVLLVSYTFPPVGGAGVQRIAKFAKYLPHYGWNVSVLTAENPSVPLYDASLLDDLDGDLVIRRARTLEPGYAIKSKIADSGKPAAGNRPSIRGVVRSGLRRMVNLLLQPDPQILWKRDAVRVGMRLLQEMPHEAIMVSAPPFSTLLVARELSRRSGLPLVVDYRDEWGLSNKYWENKQSDPISRRLQHRMQRDVLRSASAVVATTEASVASLKDECRAAGSRAEVHCIFNGFDRDDFKGVESIPPASSVDGIVRIAYVGTLWTLTTIAPLVRAIQQNARSISSAAHALRLVLAGRRTSSEQILVDELKAQGIVVDEHAYVDHSEAISLMASADHLCVLLADVPGADRVLPAKVFECLAIGRPILGITPRGELWDVLKRFPQARLFEPKDVTGIAEYLSTLVAGRHGDRLETISCDEFERRGQTRRLAAILESIALPAR